MPCVKTVKQTAILYTTPTLKSIGNGKPKMHSHKLKSGNANDSKNKRSVRDNIKIHKMPRHNVKNSNYVKLKHLRRNVPFEIQVTPSPHATSTGVNKKKHFTMNFKTGLTNHVRIIKFLKFVLKLDKPLHKLLKNPKDIKFTKSMKTKGILHDTTNMKSTTLLAKSNTSWTIINNMGVIILDPNTMKSNATTS